MSLIGLYPPASVAETLGPLGVARVIKLTEPPIASASISEVSVLFTSIVEIISAGIKSICTFLLSPSADGILSPFKVTEFKFGAKPLTIIFLASPWSFCMVIPGTLFKASPIFASGKRPTWSEEITLVMFLLVFCWLIALACPLKRSPITTTSLNSSFPGTKTNFTDTFFADSRVTVCVCF